MTHARPSQLGLTRPGLDAVFREARWGLIEVAPDGTVLRANPALEQRLGYGAGELEGMDVLLLTPEDERARTADFLGRVLSGEEVELPFAKRCLCKDGSERYEEVWVSRLTDDEGRVVSVFAQMEDVTERQLAEEELERARRLFTGGSVVLFRWGPVQGAPVEYVTPNVQALTGYSAEEVMERRFRFFDLVHPEDQERIRGEVHRFLAEGANSFEQTYRMVRRDGDVRWLYDYTLVDRGPNGEVLGFYGYVLDDTPRHEAEQALRQSAEASRRVAAFSQSLLPCRDVGELSDRVLAEMAASHQGSGAVLLWPEDQSGERLLPAAWSGSLAHAPGGSGGDFALSRRSLERLVPSGARRLTDLQRLGAEWRRLLLPFGAVVLRPLRSEGRLQGAILLVGDEPAGSDDARLHLDRLGPAIALTLQRLRVEATQRALQERLRRAHRLEAVGRLAGGVAHSFNNTLTVVLGHAARLQDVLPEGSEAWASATSIHDAGRVGAEVVRQLLDFSRRVGEGAPAAVDARSVVQRLRRMLPVAVGAGIGLRIEEEGDLASVLLHPGDFENLVMDLVFNARDALDGCGRITLRFADEPHSRRLGGRRALRLEVEDDGPGMEDGVRARIFDPFFTTKPQGRGAGLGLSSVYGLVRSAGGDLEVDSEPGRGTRFLVWLPASDAPRPGEGSPSRCSGAETSASAGRILLVEDEDGVRGLVAEMLRDFGWEVDAVSSAEDAMERLEARPVDVVVSDLLMPGLGGRGLARRLAERGDAPPLVLLTGAADGDEALAALPGVARVVRKPLVAAELREAVAACLASRR